MKKTITTVEVLDDLDLALPAKVETPATESVALTLDGSRVDLDLGAENARYLREFLRPYFAAGRRSGRQAAGNYGNMAAARRRNVRIQQWGKEQDAELRALALKAEAGGFRAVRLVRAYEAAHPEDVI
jgi:hypothetical protein